MPQISLRYAGLGILALALMTSASASAQQAGGGNPPSSSFMPPVSAGNGAPPGGDNSGWNAENANRKDLREEMEQIRKEHEELEAAREQLRTQCGNMQGLPGSRPQQPGGSSSAPPPPPPQASPECEQERQALRSRYEQLHERRLALKAKMDAFRANHPQMEQPGGMGGNFPPPQNSNGAGGAPPPNSSNPMGSPGSRPFGPPPDQ